jgi:hypothetical protein
MSSTDRRLNGIHIVTGDGGRVQLREWHKSGEQHLSFGFNKRTGYGYCHVCGTLLLKDLRAVFGI